MYRMVNIVMRFLRKGSSPNERPAEVEKRTCFALLLDSMRCDLVEISGKPHCPVEPKRC